MELIEKRLVVMNRTLKRKFGNDESKFVESLKEEVEADANGNVSCDQLKTFILNNCE
jgi:hypothetical protein